jgi:hypothetical protein
VLRKRQPLARQTLDEVVSTMKRKMQLDGLFTLIYDPLFRVISTWLWWFVGAALTVLTILAIQGVSLSSATKVLEEKQYLAVYIEIVSVGLLPVIFTLVCKDDLAQYGLTHNRLANSIFFSLLFVMAMFGWAYFTRGQLMADDRATLHLEFPWSIWYAVLGIFAWGPLEVFFVTWLITNTDQVFKNGSQLISWGLIITLIGFGALHLLTTNVYNALYNGSIFLVLMLIYKRTQNAWGPMLAWTLINGQVWYIARLLA